MKLAKEKGITFEQVPLQVGSSPKVIHLSLGEMRIQTEFLEKELANLQALLTPDAPVILSFKKAYTSTGFDLEQFAKKDFNARLKAKKQSTGSWRVGKVKMDRFLGRELCLLAWAAEHAARDECDVIAGTQVTGPGERGMSGGWSLSL